jgi:hypothetical protein
MWPAWHTGTLKRWHWPAAADSAPQAGTPRSRGRYALHAGLQALGFGPGSVYLAPAYHCRSMLDAAIALGACVRFYRLDDQLQPDLDDLRRLLPSMPAATRGQPVHVVLAAHFFGIEVPLQGLRDLCDMAGTALVEDCAHCLVDGQGRLPATLQPGGGVSGIGGWGDIVIASPYKFLPLGEGGRVWARRADLDVDAGEVAPLSHELRAAARLLRSALQPAARVPSAAPSTSAAKRPCGNDIVEGDGGAHSVQFDPKQAGQRGVVVARWLAGGCDLRSVAQRRRQRYAQWLHACQPWQLRGQCQPVHGPLPEAAVPYMFALQVPQGAQVFAHLRGQGVPAGRWDDTASSPGEAPSPWRLTLLHLPVHQEIEDDAMHWMLGVFASAMARLQAAAA